MKQHIVIGLAALMATALLAADAKEEVKNAAKKLGDASGYSFKVNTENAGGGGGGGGRMGGPTEGKTLKDGLVCLSMTRGETTIEAFAKGGKAAVKTQDGWQSTEELAQQAQGGRGGFVGRMVQNFKAPAVQAAELADKAKEVKKDGDAYVAELTEEGAKAQMTFGRGGQGGGAEVSGAKGSVKFWVKDGVLSKYELKVQGKVSFNGNDRDVDRVTTVDIKDVGTTKIEVPEEAKKKM